MGASPFVMRVTVVGFFVGIFVGVFVGALGRVFLSVPLGAYLGVLIGFAVQSLSLKKMKSFSALGDQLRGVPSHHTNLLLDKRVIRAAWTSELVHRDMRGVQRNVIGYNEAR